jgi:hypothetical protein
VTQGFVLKYLVSKNATIQSLTSQSAAMHSKGYLNNSLSKDRLLLVAACVLKVNSISLSSDGKTYLDSTGIRMDSSLLSFLLHSFLLSWQGCQIKYRMPGKKYHRLGGYATEIYFLTFLRISRSRCQFIWFLEGAGFRMTSFSLYPHTDFPWCVH